MAKKVPSGEGRIAAEMAALRRTEAATRPSAGVVPSASGGLSWTPAGGGQFIGGTPSNVSGGTSQPGAPRPAVVTPVVTPTVDTTPEDRIPVAVPTVDPSAEYYAKLERERRQNATAVMSALLESYNLTSLYNRVVGYIQDGYDADAIMALIRTTPEYKQRFPAMEALAKKGRAISESAYIEYEKTAAGLERRYGLPQNMLMGNVTKLLENEVSGDELNTRVLLASAASIQAPQEIKDALYQFYNVDSGGLTAYFLDPTVATPLLEKQYATAQIGAEAIRQNVGLDVGLAENLQSLGVTQQQAQQGFATVATQRDLTQGRGDIVTQRQQVQAVLGNDVQAQQEMQRAIGARVGRFEGGGEFLRTERGAVGLGTAETR